MLRSRRDKVKSQMCRTHCYNGGPRQGWDCRNAERPAFARSTGSIFTSPGGAEPPERLPWCCQLVQQRPYLSGGRLRARMPAASMPVLNNSGIVLGGPERCQGRWRGKDQSYHWPLPLVHALIPQIFFWAWVSVGYQGCLLTSRVQR